MTEAASTTPTDQLDTENPWPGLDAFEEEAHDYFHGRDAEAAQLLRRVTEASVTVLFGKSGLGKTSLLKAGLFPRLRENHFLPVYVRLAVRPQAPPLIEQIRDSLLVSLQRERVDAPEIAPDETLWAYLHRAELELWSTENQLLTPVLVLDQFEEVFTLGEVVPEAVAQFRLHLGDLAENRIPAELAVSLRDDEEAAGGLDMRRVRYKLVVSLREDFLPELEGWVRAIPALARDRVRLLRMRPEQAFSAIYDSAPHLMDPALARRIVQFVATAQADAETTAPRPDGNEPTRGEIEPALMSLFCRGLNEQRKRAGMPRFDERLVESAKQGIIADYYQACLEGMPDRVSHFIGDELITEKGFRNSYARDDAVPAYLTQEQLDRLINHRLIRLEARYGTQRIELTHDLLTRAVREHRDRRRAEEEKAALERRAEQERKTLAEQVRVREERVEAERRAERDQRLQAEVQAGRRFKRLAALLAAALVATVAVSFLAYKQAKIATDAREAANAQKKLAELRLRRITDGIRMKQATLAGNREHIRTYLDSDLANPSIRFTARKQSLGYRDDQGRQVYKYSLFPERASLPGGEAAVAAITYRMDHPTFQNALLATGPDRDFTASYAGWGCLVSVVALIEYVNPDQSPQIAQFDMCDVIERYENPRR